MVLLGANGCGKSTVLKLLGGLLDPTVGIYRYRGTPVNARTLRDRAWQRSFRSEVVLLFQQPDAMLFNPTVFDEIAYGLRQQNLSEAAITDRVRAVAAEFGLGPLLEDTPFRLSGGEKQKVCLAALLVLEPQLLLLDEPTANLDPRSAGQLITRLRGLSLTTVTATHNLTHAADLGNRAVVLGEMHETVYDGPLDALLTDEALMLAANLTYRPPPRPDGG